MPTPGPVAYHRQCFARVVALMSMGWVHVWPSSVLFMSHTVRGSLATPFLMAPSDSSPRLRVSGIHRVPVAWSTTGQGLPMTCGPWSAITCIFDHVRPPSVLRFITMSMSPVSLRLFLRPSAKASRSPLGLTMMAGMR